MRSIPAAARLLLVALAFGVLLAACGRSERVSAIDRLHACSSTEGPTDAYCGVLTVFEDRERQQGRTIGLKIVLLPALGSSPKPDPLFFLAGGPGQGAAAMALPLRDLFRRVQADRDIVLVDQRGTGKSHPLDCKTNDESLKLLNETEEAAMARLRACLTAYDADPRLYMTTIAMDDLDAVRRHLGYDTINLYGGSYGTRAAMVYLRRHEPTVRSVILDGVAPTDMRLPLFFARDAQRALDRLFADCEAESACRGQFPRLAERLRETVATLEASPATVRLTHPRTGIAEEVQIDGEFVVNVLFGALYSPLTSMLIPELVTRAEERDFQGLLALGMVGDTGLTQNMSAGMQLSVVCAEDYPRITPDQITRASEGTVFADYLMRSRLKACEFWPRGKVDPSYYEPVTSAVPVLIMSGDLDPVTPPNWGASVAPHFSNSVHIVVPGTGHGTISTACGLRIAHAFLDAASPSNLDTRCVQAIKRPPFFLTPAGPDPAGVTQPAS